MRLFRCPTITRHCLINILFLPHKDQPFTSWIRTIIAVAMAAAAATAAQASAAVAAAAAAAAAAAKP